jgi:hypothetical protein
VLFDDLLSKRQSIATAHWEIIADRESVWRAGSDSHPPNVLTSDSSKLTLTLRRRILFICLDGDFYLGTFF